MFVRPYIVTLIITLIAGCGGGKPATPGPAAKQASAQTPPASEPAPGPTTTTVTKAGEPPIVFEPPSLNLGLLGEGQSKTGSVQIRNVGDEAIRIVKTVPSCACAFIKSVENTTLQPGEAVTMEAALTPKPGTGVKHEEVRVIVEGYQKYRTLSIDAEVILGIRAIPPDIQAFRLGNTGTVKVESVDGRPFTILRTADRQPDFIDYTPADTPRASYVLRWDLAGYTEQTMPWWWIIETDHPTTPMLDVRIKHNFTRNPHITPRWVQGDRRILAGIVRPGEPFEFETKIKFNVKGGTAPNVRPTVRSVSGNVDALVLSSQVKGTDIVYSVRITPLTTQTGLLYEDLLVSAYGGTYPVTVIASVR